MDFYLNGVPTLIPIKVPNPMATNAAQTAADLKMEMNGATMRSGKITPMSWEKHDDSCPGCRPVLMDLKTRKVLPPDSPAMTAINNVWAKTTPAEREAFHRVTCKNSRDLTDMMLCQGITSRIQKALSRIN